MKNPLFNARLRVYNLRLLLLTLLVDLVWWSGRLPDGYGELQPQFMAGAGAVLAHHLLSVYHWPVPMLAVVDFLILSAEITTVVFWVILPSTWGFTDDGIKQLIVSAAALIPTLALSVVFRLATIIKTKERFYLQRVRFLGGCRRTVPEYTPLAIVLNRSLARPLVRGESKFIIWVRACTISLIAIGVPAFGIYFAIIVPSQPERCRPTSPCRSPQAWTTTLRSTRALALKARSEGEVDFIYAWTVIRCGFGWNRMAWLTIGIDVASTERGELVHLEVLPWSAKRGYINDLSTFGDPHPANPTIRVIPGSRIAAIINWELFRVNGSADYIYKAEFTSLQPDPVVSKFNTSITLYNPSGNLPTKYFDVTTDDSVLSGLATLGGFWTFVNGAFALLFGANVIYFAFGRRPLSALGVVHLFQRRALVRKWHEDFPQLQTEGGAPGSESAGIVAFIRERLVDMEDRPHIDAAATGEQEPSKLEREASKVEDETEISLSAYSSQESLSTPRAFLSKSGYYVEDMQDPAIDVG
ncbi:hypothetical protein C8F01DRAFT_1351780 [Mycena amicta]|nr:hypothetical protein C8F01DRAFT_1351780 [Mycena amicta]